MSSDVGVERICSILDMERSCYLINSFFFWIVDQSYSALHLKCHSSNEVCKFADIICTWQHLFLYPIPFRPRFHLRYVHFSTRMWSRTIEMLMKIGANGVKQLFIFFLNFLSSELYRHRKQSEKVGNSWFFVKNFEKSL